MVILVSYHFHEAWIDKNGKASRVFEENLPHRTQIIKDAVKSWNEIVRPEFLHSGYDNEIKSIRACPSCKNKDSMCIGVELLDGYHWNKEKQDAILQALEAQFCDGWGDGFFGLNYPFFDEQMNLYYCVE